MFYFIEKRKIDAKTMFDTEYKYIFSLDTKVSNVLITAYAFSDYLYKNAVSVELKLFNESNDLICILHYVFNDSNFINKVKEMESELSYQCIKLSALERVHLSSEVIEIIYTCIRSNFPVTHRSINYKNK